MTAANSFDIEKVVQTLEEADEPQSDFVRLMDSFKSPYLVLIACILSLRTNDRTTYPATLRMLELGKTPDEIAKVKLEDLEKAIYPVGFYKNKAGQIIELSKILVEKYNSKVPDEIDELVKFKGVGRKTANLVLARGFNKPAICVDVHVHRIFNRLGYVKTQTPEETEFALRKKLPKKFWIEINTLIVTHGQNICKPQKPLCSECPIEKFCPKKIEKK
jgi:endonuclease-3